MPTRTPRPRAHQTRPRYPVRIVDRPGDRVTVWTVLLGMLAPGAPIVAAILFYLAHK